MLQLPAVAGQEADRQTSIGSRRVQADRQVGRQTDSGGRGQGAEVGHLPRSQANEAATHVALEDLLEGLVHALKQEPWSSVKSARLGRQ